MRLVASDLDDLPIAIGCLAVVAFGLMEPTKTFVAIVRAGEACQHVVSGLFGRVEFPGVDKSEHGIGCVIQLVTAVMAEERLLVSRIGGECRMCGYLVVGHAAALVFLAAAARAEIIPSDSGHLANVSSKDGSLVPSGAG